MTDEVKTIPSDEQKKAALAIKKFYEIEPDATNVIYKIAKFAKAKPADYKVLKGHLDKEISKIMKG